MSTKKNIVEKSDNRKKTSSKTSKSEKVDRGDKTEGSSGITKKEMKERVAKLKEVEKAREVERLEEINKPKKSHKPSTKGSGSEKKHVKKVVIKEYSSEGEDDSYERKKPSKSSKNSKDVKEDRNTKEKSAKGSSKTKIKEEIREENEELEDEESSEPAEGTPKYFEKAMISTIKEFCTYTASITKDLEDTEQREIEETQERNKDNGLDSDDTDYEEIPDPIWTDSTLKINLIGGLLNTMFKPSKLLKYYIVYVLPMKPWLTTRDEKFFLDNDHIYPNAPKEDIVFFKNLWAVEGTMTPDEKNTIWEFWDTLIEIAEDWQSAIGWNPDEDSDFSYDKIDYTKGAADSK